MLALFLQNWIVDSRERHLVRREILWFRGGALGRICMSKSGWWGHVSAPRWVPVMESIILDGRRFLDQCWTTVDWWCFTDWKDWLVYDRSSLVTLVCMPGRQILSFIHKLPYIYWDPTDARLWGFRETGKLFLLQGDLRVLSVTFFFLWEQFSASSSDWNKMWSSPTFTFWYDGVACPRPLFLPNITITGGLKYQNPIY